MASAPRDRALLLAFFLSGCAALGYELLWTQLLGLALGSEILAVLGVLAGFFGGMAAGSAMLHDRAVRSPNPARLFAGLEAIAAAYALLSPYILYGLADLLPPLIGEVAGNNDSPLALILSMGVTALALLPGTFCMGATLPALVEARRRSAPDDPEGRGVGRLYAANTAGATAGVLLTVYFILPALGMAFGSALLSLLGLVAAVIGLRYSNRIPAGQPFTAVPEEPVLLDTSRDPDPDVARERWLLLVLMACTGLLGVGLEVVGVQVLSQVLENTLYTFADILAVYLVGTSLGAAAYTRFAKPAITGRPATVAAAGMIGLAMATIGATVTLGHSEALLQAVAPAGSSYGRHLLSEMVVAAAVFGPSTVLMGGVFSHLMGLLAPGGAGRAYALNTLGSAAAPVVFGLWVIPEAGYRDGMFVVVYAYLALFGLFTWFRRFKALWQVGPILAVVALTAVGPPSLVLVGPGEEWTVLEQRVTAMGLVIVSQHDEATPPLRRLQVGRHFRMGGARAFGERRMGHLPLLLHPDPERVLFLGVGTGATLGAVTAHGGVEHVDAVEIVPAVLDALHFFDAINGEVRSDPRVQFHAADARRFVAASSERYDIVVADLFHPAREGAGALFAREHFETVREHLEPGGLFAQWLPLHQLDPETLRLIVRTFLAAFDDVHSFLGIYNVQTPAMVLIGRAPSMEGEPLHVALEDLRVRLQEPVFQELLMQDPRDLLGAYLLDRQALEAFGGDGPLNTDLHPRVSTQAPRSAYEDDPLGPANLEALFSVRSGPPPGFITGAEGEPLAAFERDVQRFGQALDLYLQGERIRVAATERTMPPPEAIERYLEAYAYAPDFAPARGMLLASAARSGDIAEQVFPRMLTATPDEPRVVESYRAYLRRIGDTRRLSELGERPNP